MPKKHTLPNSDTPTPGGQRPGAGRKPKIIDLIEVEKLALMHSTLEEMADFFGVSSRTLRSRQKQPEFAAALRRGRAKGRITVRRAQFKLLDAGNAAMAIWLGKQLLSQRDVTPVELSGPQGQPLRLSLEAVDEILDRAHHSSAPKPGKSKNSSSGAEDE